MEILSSLFASLLFLAAVLGFVGGIVAVALVVADAPAQEFASAYRVLSFFGWDNYGCTAIFMTGLLCLVFAFTFHWLHFEDVEASQWVVRSIAVHFSLFTVLAIAEHFLHKRIEAKKKDWQKLGKGESRFS
jgi:hypothetical protein